MREGASPLGYWLRNHDPLLGQSDQGAQGWPPCLRSSRYSSERLPCGQPTTVWTPALWELNGYPPKVDSSPGYAVRQPSGYYKHLSHAKSCHPAAHRNPGAQGTLEHDCTETTDKI